jgi:uncharacterized membrane protein
MKNVKSNQGTSVIKSIDVEVPVRTAYDQWTQFEEFPRFMEGVEEVRQIDDANLHWRAEIGGQDVEWTARITEQIPDQRIAWTSTSGARNAGVVTFHHLAPDRCRVTLQLDYEPQGVTEKVGDWLGVVGRRAEGDLERFKEFIEERGAPTGAFRGEIRPRDSMNR